MKAKKYNIFLLGSICLTLCGCTSTGGKQADLYYALASENLMSDWNYLDKNEDFIEENESFYDRDHTLRFHLMKNENDGAQLMIYANQYINSFDFELPTLTNEDGATIGADQLSVAAAWYMEIEGSNERNAYTGWYPDALIPLENYKYRRFNHIDKGRNQSLYFNVKTKEDTAAGLYKGTGKLTLDGKIYNVPFEVNVYDAVMPDEVSMRTCYLIWYEEIQKGEKLKATPEMSMKYYDFTVSKRLAPSELPPEYLKDLDVFVEAYTEKVAKNPKVSNYRLPYVGNSANESNLKNILSKLIAKNIQLRENGDHTTDLFRKLILYPIDEPSGETYLEVKRIDKLFYEVKKAMAYRLDAYPDLKDSFMHINNLITIGYSDTLVGTEEEGGVQTWCPQYQHFNSPEARARYKERQQSNLRECGESVWWYGCMDPASPFPSYHLDADALNIRTVNFMQYNYDIEGRIYWNMCWFSKQVGQFQTSRDIWHDPITWLRCAGDGTLCYPGVEFGVDGPITTLRLENILNGNEEYEYLVMIDKKVQEYNALNGTSYETNTLLQKYYSQLYTNVISITDDTVFEAVRTELLQVIEKLNQDLNAGMSLLLK